MIFDDPRRPERNRMLPTRIRDWTLAALVGLGFASTSLAGPPTDRLNERVAGLALPGSDGKPVALTAGKGGAAVVVFLSFDCPVSNSYFDGLNELAKSYAGRGVKVYGVVPGEEPTAALAAKVAEYKVGFPVLADPKFAATDALKAGTVPEAFVLDPGGVVRYRGRIDDGYSARLKRNPTVSSHDLKDALDAVLAGKSVTTQATTAIGCAIYRPHTTTAVTSTVTFHKDVLPILQASCQGCHRPGQAGPFTLTSYKHAVTWADDIKKYTQSKEMPPWKPVGGPGYVNERKLSDFEIATLAKWVDAGCPEGDAKDTPPPATFPDGWQLGPPDLVLTASEDFHVGPTGPDAFRCFVLPTGLDEDKFVVGYEVKPGNPRVVHHTLNFWDRSGKARELAEKEAKRPKSDTDRDRGPGYPVAMGLGFIPLPMADRPNVPPTGAVGGWAPGQLATKLPDDVAFFLPKGADMVIQTHYHRTGKPEDDRPKIGLYFAKTPVKKQWQSVGVGDARFGAIPAGAASHKVKMTATLGGDATLYNVTPHMHLIGRSVKVSMTPPDGDPVTLVDIPDWDYNWQETYWFKTPIKAKSGTRIDVEAVYDNSSANPLNPNNPPKLVTFGEQTTNEMLFGFVGLTADQGNRVPVKREPIDLKKLLLRQLTGSRNADPPADGGGAKPVEKKTVAVPYRLTDTKHVLVRAKLNGKGPYNFILDTGAPAVFVPKGVADAVGLKPAADGWGSFDTFEIEGGVIPAKARAKVEDLYQLTGMNGMGLAGVELHGVIGYEVLAKYRLTIDLTKSKLAWVPLDFDPPPLVPLGKGKGGGSGLEVLGPVMKGLAGLIGITPKFDAVPRGRVGVEVEDRDGGVVVTAVLADSTAAKAGFKVGDRIASADGNAIATVDALRTALAARSAGTEVSLTARRDGADVPVKVTLEGGL